MWPGPPPAFFLLGAVRPRPAGPSGASLRSSPLSSKIESVRPKDPLKKKEEEEEDEEEILHVLGALSLVVTPGEEKRGGHFDLG